MGVSSRMLEHHGSSIRPLPDTASGSQIASTAALVFILSGTKRRTAARPPPPHMSKTPPPLPPAPATAASTVLATATRRHLPRKHARCGWYRIFFFLWRENPDRTNELLVSGDSCLLQFPLPDIGARAAATPRDERRVAVARAARLRTLRREEVGQADGLAIIGVTHACVVSHAPPSPSSSVPSVRTCAPRWFGVPRDAMRPSHPSAKRRKQGREKEIALRDTGG